MNSETYIKDLTTRYGSALLTKRQAAKELQISVTQLDRIRKTGELKFTKVGAQIRIPVEAIADMA